METVTDFIYLGSKIAVDSERSHEIKRHLLLGRTVMANQDSILKSRDIILLTNVHIVKAMVFSGDTFKCECWTIKIVEHWRSDAFEFCGAEDDSRVPWTARRSNQSTINEINLEYSLEGLMLKQKHQYFGPLMQEADSLENTLMLGKIEGRRRRGQ